MESQEVPSWPAARVEKYSYSTFNLTQTKLLVNQWEDLWINKYSTKNSEKRTISESKKSQISENDQIIYFNKL